MKRKLLALLTVAMISATAVCPAYAAETDTAEITSAETTSEETASDQESDAEVITGKIDSLPGRYGNIQLDIDPKALFDAGFEYGDMVAVTFDGQTYIMPLGTEYSDVDQGDMILRHVNDNPEENSGYLIVAINMGNFAKTNGIAEYVTNEDGTAEWKSIEGATPYDEMVVTIEMEVKQGYADQYTLHKLNELRKYDRADYSSNTVYANFRNVEAGLIGPNAFYRSSSPVDNSLNRAAFADELSRRAGIKAFINLANIDSEVEEYAKADDFHSPYYMSVFENKKVIALGLGVDYNDDSFKKGMADAIRFIGENDGPYLVHCTEGKDRAGFTSLLIESLMGASLEDMKKDYMKTFENYFYIETTEERYDSIWKSNGEKALRNIAGVDNDASLDGVDFMKAATDYLIGAGLTEAEIEKAVANLSKEYAAPAFPLDKDVPFTDMPDAASDYYLPINWAYVFGLTTGSGDGTTFTPDGEAFRGDFVTLLARYLAKSLSGNNPFTDVTEEYMVAPVAWASSNGYVKGTGDTTFSPFDEVTRGQVVTILHRIAGEPEAEATEDAKNFDDVEEGAYYADAVAWGTANNIVKGTGDSTFSPDGTCTRAQMMTFIYRAQDLIKGE